MTYKSWILSVSFFLLFATVMFFSCSSHKPELVPEMPEMESDTVVFEDRISAGTLDNKSIGEASGMAMSVRNENAFWTHNDSGDEARLFLVSTSAQYQATCTLEGAVNRDWEDIAVSKDPVSGKSRIFIGDIGDNLAVYDYSTIYILDEPVISAIKDITVSQYDKIIFRYEDGRRDAETLLVDPLKGDIYIVSKRESSVQLYKISYPYNFIDTLTAKKLMSIPFTQIVGGDISTDGTEILLKNYNKVWYWPRKKGETIAEALSQKSYETPYIQEPQGESICWTNDANAFFTISETTLFKVSPVLYKYKKK